MEKQHCSLRCHPSWHWNKSYTVRNTDLINSLAPGRCGYNPKLIFFFKIITRLDIWNISCEIALRWMPQNTFDDKSTLVQVMAWCCQATSHYLSQWWPRLLSPYGATRSQWVNPLLCWIFLRRHRIICAYHAFPWHLHLRTLTHWPLGDLNLISG